MTDRRDSLTGPGRAPGNHSVPTGEARWYTLLADALDYPRPGLAERCAQLDLELARVRPEAAEAFRPFLEAVRSRPFAELEELYAATFDVNPACCLYVGYHLFGESYKRGSFMAELTRWFRERGFDPGNELPDHLPVLLRFLAQPDDPERVSMLLEGAILPALAVISHRFDDTSNVYGTLVRAALLALEPTGYVPPHDASRALPVLGPESHTPER